MSYFFPPNLIRLKAFLGANGIRTTALETAHDVIDVTNVLFSLAFEHGMTDDEDLAILLHQQDTVAFIPKPDRRILVRKNLKRLPLAVVSLAPGNREKRVGTMRKRDLKHMARQAAPLL